MSMGSPNDLTRLMGPKSLPSDSVLYAPVFQEEQLEQLYKKLRENSHPETNILKEKLIEKAKNTLNLLYLPNSPTICPFFHFDEFKDVHLSFLQHYPPFTPWFSIIETYFGLQTLELHRSVYSILLEYAKSKNEAETQAEPEQEHDHLIEIDYSDEFDRPAYKILPLHPQRSHEHDNSSRQFVSPEKSQEMISSSARHHHETSGGLAASKSDETYWNPHDELDTSDEDEDYELSLDIQGHYSNSASRRSSIPSSHTATEDGGEREERDLNEQTCTSSASSQSNSCNSSTKNERMVIGDANELSAKRENIDLKSNLSKFIESKRRASRPLRYSDFVPL